MAYQTQTILKITGGDFDVEVSREGESIVISTIKVGYNTTTVHFAQQQASLIAAAIQQLLGE
jgi:hypothetical protein